MKEHLWNPAGITLASAPGLGLVLLTCLLLALSLDASARLYKWVDENGAVQFADRPPSDVAPDAVEGPKHGTVGEELERRRLRKRSQAQAEAAAANQALLEQQAAEQTGEDNQAPPPEINVKSKWTCEQAQQFQSYFASANAGQFYTPNADGTYRQTSASEIAALARQWEEAAKTLCQPGVKREPLTPAPQPVSGDGEQASEPPDINLSTDEFAPSADDTENVTTEEGDEASSEAETSS